VRRYYFLSIFSIFWFLLYPFLNFCFFFLLIAFFFPLFTGATSNLVSEPNRRSTPLFTLLTLNQRRHPTQPKKITRNLHRRSPTLRCPYPNPSRHNPPLSLHPLQPRSPADSVRSTHQPAHQHPDTPPLTNNPPSKDLPSIQILP
jgi:hypothetical protein